MTRSSDSTVPIPPAAPRARVSPALLVLALGPAVALGLGRFGYGLLLPEMRTDLGWSYAQAGFVNTANAIGYLIGAFLAAPLLARWDNRRVFLAAMAAVVLSLFATAGVTDFTLLGLVRVITGIAGAVVFVGGGALLAGTGAEVAARRGFHLAAYYSGVGFGLLLAGLVLPVLMARPGSGDWPLGWLVLGGLALPLLLAVWHRTRPAGDAAAPAPPGTAGAEGRIGWMLLGYLFYGTGSIGYMTFITAQLGAEGQGWSATTIFWAIFALGAACAPFLWERTLERRSSARAFLVITGANALAAALPLVPLGAAALLASAFVFGLSFFTIVAVTTLHVARATRPDRRAQAIGLFSVVFGLGQAAGPILVGAVSDRAGTLDAGLLLGAALIALGAALGARQR
jgi:predicted MFS family arabinose efflux permease